LNETSLEGTKVSLCATSGAIYKKQLTATASRHAFGSTCSALFIECIERQLYHGFSRRVTVQSTAHNSTSSRKRASDEALTLIRQ
jgi:hypothetical protein